MVPAGKRVHMSLLANPSHLEAVDPVVLGKVQKHRHLWIVCVWYWRRTMSALSLIWPVMPATIVPNCCRMLHSSHCITGGLRHDYSPGTSGPHVG